MIEQFTKYNNVLKGFLKETVAMGDKIAQIPETGYKEWKTLEHVKKELDNLNVSYVCPEDIPALKYTFDTGKAGPTVAFIAELDAILCPTHPNANKDTGAAHACGHNMQPAVSVAIIKLLNNCGISENLCGKIDFVFVPAEELIETEYRMELRESGVIKLLGGKQELLSRGYFDNSDMAFMLHVRPGDRDFYLVEGSNVILIKKAVFSGIAAHTGSPWNGINALAAANLALSAINAQRSCFNPDDMVRIEPIITKCDGALNTLSTCVEIQTYIRAINMDIGYKAGLMTDKALLAGALAMGAKVDIHNSPGYFELKRDLSFEKLCFKTMQEISNDNAVMLPPSGGSTDMGDVSQFIPCVHAYVGGAVGDYHSENFEINNIEKAYYNGTLFVMQVLYKLLCDKAVAAEKIIANYKPTFETKEQYSSYMDNFFKKVST